MAPTSSVTPNAPAAAGAAPASADFLRRLSVADAKVLLERTRKEKESKTKEMQKMIGVRYRDLIESADKIVNMHSAALRLEGSLKEMPREWKRVEAALAKTLADASRLGAPTTSAPVEASGALAKELVTPSSSVLEQVQFLVAVPEQMWQWLDRGESFRALQLYLAATDVHASAGYASLVSAFPFLPTAWSCIEGFRPRMLACARTYLTCRGQASSFYAQNLCTLAVLSEPRMSAEQLVHAFLDARAAWMAPPSSSTSSAAVSAPRMSSSEQSFAQQERYLTVVVRSVNLTLLHAEAIFDATSKFAALHGATALQPALQHELEHFVASGSLQQAVTQWFVAQRSKIDVEVSRTISTISTISLLARVQSKLSKANALDGDCAQSPLWRAVALAVTPVPAAAAAAPPRASEDSPFSLLFADAFRKRTRDLVQHSFVEALDAIEAQIRAVVDDAASESSRGAMRLGAVTFYDYFEQIQTRAAALDASDLQSVLMEEFVSTLFKLVLFFEREYPLDGERSSADDEPKHLCLSNLLSAILADLPARSSKLFPTSSCSAGAISSDRTSFALVRAAFEASAIDGARLSRAALDGALQTLCQPSVASAPAACFLDDELETLESVGLHAFHVVVAIKQRTSHAETFASVVRELSRAYCERWAQSHLHRKIAPLRERIRMEQYDASNEEWIKTHDGWVQQVITAESLESDLDDSASETEAFSEERVWLPWCETTTVSSFLFQCCYMLDDANRLVRTSASATAAHVALMHQTIRDVLVEQLTLISVDAYEEGVARLVAAKAQHKTQSVLNFGECCILQFLFDMYFVRATLGFSDFIRFGWGDELDPSTCSPGLRKLLELFGKMQDFVDPVDWEIYGPQLVENVVVQFRKSRLLFSSLSESNDINEINGKQVAVSAQDTRPIVRIAEPVARFSLLPVPSSSRRLQRKPSPTPGRLDPTTADAHERAATPSHAAARASLFQEPRASESSSATLKLQSILSSSATGSNLLSAAASGTNLLSSAAKSMSYLSSATSSYLREGESRPKYF